MSAWGYSWGRSWGVSWGPNIPPPPAPPLPPQPVPTAHPGRAWSEPLIASLSWDGPALFSVEWAGADLGGLAWGGDEGGLLVTTLAWSGYDVVAIEWDGTQTAEGVMYQVREPVRRQNLIPFTYTYRDLATGQAVSLASYTRVAVEVKLNGEVYAWYPATFVDKVNGVVTAGLRFERIGKWDLQFVCFDWLNRPFYGTPAQFDCVNNVDDLALAQNLEV